MANEHVHTPPAIPIFLYVKVPSLPMQNQNMNMNA